MSSLNFFLNYNQTAAFSMIYLISVANSFISKLSDNVYYGMTLEGSSTSPFISLYVRLPVCPSVRPPVYMFVYLFADKFDFHVFFHFN